MLHAHKRSQIHALRQWPGYLYKHQLTSNASVRARAIRANTAAYVKRSGSLEAATRFDSVRALARPTVRTPPSLRNICGTRTRVYIYGIILLVDGRVVCYRCIRTVRKRAVPNS